MKHKDIFMSSPICVKILKYQCIPKNFPLLCRQVLQFITLKQTIFFSQLQLANNFIYEKGTPPPPPIKNNGPSLIGLIASLFVLSGQCQTIIILKSMGN